VAGYVEGLSARAGRLKFSFRFHNNGLGQAIPDRRYPGYQATHEQHRTQEVAHLDCASGPIDSQPVAKRSGPPSHVPMWPSPRAVRLNYNGLQVKVEKIFSTGLQFLASYPWGHYIDLGGSGFSLSAAPQNDNNFKADLFYVHPQTSFRHQLLRSR